MPTQKVSKITTEHSDLFLRASKGHFASTHLHSNYYIDVAAQKSRLSEAKAVAKEICRNYRYNIKQLIGAAKMLGASNAQVFFQIVVPSAVPSIFSGAQVSLSNSWMTMLAAEMVRSSEGVGWIIIAGQSVNNMTQMLAGMLAIGIVGLALATGMRLLEERCLRWQGK